MTTRRTLLKTSAAAATVLAAPAFVRAQSFPSRPLRLIVASAAGGNADVVTRLMAPELEQRLGRHQARDHVGVAAGRRSDDQAQRARRKILGAHNRWGGDQGRRSGR